jgi:hypothetical protein
VWQNPSHRSIFFLQLASQRGQLVWQNELIWGIFEAISTNKQTNKKRQVWIVFHVEMIIWKKEKHKKAGVNRFPRWNLTVTYALSNGDGEAISYFFQWAVMFFTNWGIKKRRESDIICLLENNFISKSNFFLKWIIF